MADDSTLDELRTRIDEIDSKLLELISQRAHMATEVARVKNEKSDDNGFYRPEREAQVLRKILDRNPGPLSDEEMARLFREVMSAFLALRGMQTLELRVHRQNESAMKIATYLEQHEKIKVVYYPGLPSHPDHEIARKQMTGFGGMLSFEVNGDFDRTKLFMDRLKRIKLATSLGGVTSLANQPITNTHVALSPENRAKAGISESLVRLSVGVEKVDLLMDDLKQALAEI